jgi:hypothetical protein
MMFKENKYTRWYFLIIENIKNEDRIRDYHERHHIIPKSMGGDDSPTNLVLLTYREHFLCHWLLIKAVVSSNHKGKMQHALSKMCRVNKHQKRIVASWQYEIARKELSDVMRNRRVSDETKKKMSIRGKLRVGEKNSFYGKHHTPESRKRLSESKTGENHPFYGKKRPEHSERMKEVMAGKEKSPEHKLNISKTWKQSRTQITCEHCGKLFYKHMYTQWHGDKCKARELTNGQ